MAKKDAFILVSLEGAKAKKLASVVSSEGSRKIMNHLADTEGATETEISKSLGIAMSTVHYNMKLLRESGLWLQKSFTTLRKDEKYCITSLRTSTS